MTVLRNVGVRVDDIRALKQMREHAWLDYGEASLSNRASREHWFKNSTERLGGKTMDKAKDILDRHSHPEIEPNTNRKMTEILDHARNSIMNS